MLNLVGLGAEVTFFKDLLESWAYPPGSGAMAI
jgi:hypothetical protein